MPDSNLTPRVEVRPGIAMNFHLLRIKRSQADGLIRELVYRARSHSKISQPTTYSLLYVV